MKIEVLGTGCPKCVMLMKLVNEALAELDIKADVSKVDKINDIMNFNVMVTPALVVDGKVKVAGKVPSLQELKDMLKKIKEESNG